MIIAIKENDRVVIGYTNTESWNRLSEKDYIDEENVAIKLTQDGNLFACAEMNRTADILLYDEELLSKEITPRSIVREIIPHIKDSLKKNGKKIDEKNDWGNALLICDGNRIYDIDPYFVFCEGEDYICHGHCTEALKCGLDETVGMPARDRIMKVVIFVSDLHKESLFPLIITDTKSRRFEYVFEGEKKYEYSDRI